MVSHILLNSKGEVVREDLENVEEKLFSRYQVISGSEVSFPGSSSDSLTQQMTTEQAITVGLQKSSESVVEKPKAVVTMKPPAAKPKQARKYLSLRLEDEDSALLTVHQKEVMTARHDQLASKVGISGLHGCLCQCC